MTRSIRKRLAAALRWTQPGSWWETIAVIAVPRRVRDTVPRWSPGPGYIEAMTATVWIRPVGDGHATAVVVLDDVGDTPVMVTGTVPVEDVVGPGGLCDKPHRIRWLAVHPPTITPLAADHPAARYQAWCQHTAAHLDQLLHCLGRLRHLVPAQAVVSATRHDGIQVAVEIRVEPGPWRRYDVHAHAALLAGVLRHYGRGTRLRFHPPTADDVIDPLYHQAWRLLQTNRSAGPSAPDAPAAQPRVAEHGTAGPSSASAQPSP